MAAFVQTKELKRVGVARSSMRAGAENASATEDGNWNALMS